MVAHEEVPSRWPEVTWGRAGGPLAKLILGFAATPAGTWLSKNAAPLDCWLIRRSRGRFTLFGPIGATLLLLTHTGRKTGRRYTTPLLYLPDGKRLIIIGSNYGQDRQPNWAMNLRAHPDAQVTIAGHDIPVTATEILGTDRDTRYHELAEHLPIYRVFEKRAGHRVIPMFAITAREVPTHPNERGLR
ncbi:nitroreductase family deazaflavin-dependent oxidoreductase [Nocardia panacis]|uniref:nitroreductase family deazaflavin-dependent oxidoreductase n=1 Tax=Nocardia panacis TaxID=2340916 RepID=UPI0013152038|nr:nitroreductase family deazaflavin-dependent oxidoreductase [Nocardia panacis]